MKPRMKSDQWGLSVGRQFRLLIDLFIDNNIIRFMLGVINYPRSPGSEASLFLGGTRGRWARGLVPVSSDGSRRVTFSNSSGMSDQQLKSTMLGYSWSGILL